jgi:hypothetical protein
MAKKQNEQDRLSALLASVNEDMLGDGLPRHLTDNSINVERILLELVRPDPIQPRRVLPEQIHHGFHGNRLTPTQSLRELVQIAQVGARQHGRPFSNILELLSDPERDVEDVDHKLTPEETLLRDLVNLAVTIRDDGQVNPITVIDVTQGATQQFRIETGERRYWASWILRDFIQGEHDGMIDCIIVPDSRSSIFRQAKENTARSGLSAIAMARQAALLLLTANEYVIPDHVVDNDFYRQALDLRIPRGMGQAIYSAMGGVSKRRFSYFKDLLRLSDEAIELADRYSMEERLLRPLLTLPSEDHAEMIQQIIQLDLTSRQVESIVSDEPDEPSKEGNVLSSQQRRFIKSITKESEQSPSETALLFARQHGDAHMAYAYLKQIAEHFGKAAESLLDDS